MPVFDPSPLGPDLAVSTPAYFELARCQRRRWATNTLAIWNKYLLDPFFRGIPLYNPFPPYNVLPGGASAAKASALYWIWQILTCGQLDRLLDVQYRGTNLPFVYKILDPVQEQQFNTLQLSLAQTKIPEVYDCDCMEGRRKIICVNGVPTVQPPTPPGYLQYVFQSMD